MSRVKDIGVFGPLLETLRQRCWSKMRRARARTPEGNQNNLPLHRCSVVSELVLIVPYNLHLGIMRTTKFNGPRR